MDNLFDFDELNKMLKKVDSKQLTSKEIDKYYDDLRHFVEVWDDNTKNTLQVKTMKINL